jgi:predicted DNA-binding transcriptional regulator AlpA
VAADPILHVHDSAAHRDATASAALSVEAGRPASALLLTARQAAAMCGVSLATWHRMVSAGRCPAPLRLSRGCVRWRAGELAEWVAAGCPPRREFEARRAARRWEGGQ